MRILITGAAGQLGSTLAASLIQQHTVLGLDPSPGPYTTHVGSVADRDLIFSMTKGIEAIIHTASLHARHLPTHPRSAFVETNIQGTLNLLEAAVENGVQRFIYTSTTSLYGRAMVSAEQAVWVTESLIPKPRDIYDVTKIAAEELCQIISAAHGLPCISLRVSRFFPEPDNLIALYRLYRGVDVRDAAMAHLLALQANLTGFEVFNISARSPFSEAELPDLRHNAPSVLLRHFPGLDSVFAERSWTLPASIDRVYVIAKAEQQLGYHPRFNFEAFIREAGLKL